MGDYTDFSLIADEIIKKSLRKFIDKSDQLSSTVCSRHVEMALNVEPHSLELVKEHRERFKKILADTCLEQQEDSEEEDECDFAVEDEEEYNADEDFAGKKRKRRKEKQVDESHKRRKIEQESSDYGPRLTGLRNLARACNLTGPRLYKFLSAMDEEDQIHYLEELFDSRNISHDHFDEATLNKIKEDYALKKELEEIQNAVLTVDEGPRKSRRAVKYSYSDDEENLDEEPYEEDSESEFEMDPNEAFDPEDL